MVATTRDVASSPHLYLRAFPVWLASHGFSEESRRTYVANISFFAKWCERSGVDPVSADKAAIADFLMAETLRVARGTVRNRLAALRAFYRFIADYGLRTDDPTLGMIFKKARTMPKTPLTIGELRRLAHKTGSVRDEAIVMVLATTGVRVGELAKMKVENINWLDEQILIEGKGMKERLVAPGHEVMRLLRDVVANRQSGPVWLTADGAPMGRDRLRQNFYRLAKRARIPAYPHLLRATFANMFMQSGADLSALQSALGHSDIATTAHYAAGTRAERGLSAMVALGIGRQLCE